MEDNNKKRGKSKIFINKDSGDSIINAQSFNTAMGERLELYEDGLSRILQHVEDDGTFAIIGSEDKDTKKDRSLELWSLILNLSDKSRGGKRIGFKHLEGTYRYADGTPAKEKSYIIYNIKKEEALKIAKKINQETIIWKDKDFFGFLDMDGNSVGELGKGMSLDAEKVQEYGSRLLGKHNKAKGFVFEVLEYPFSDSTFSKQNWGELKHIKIFSIERNNPLTNEHLKLHETSTSRILQHMQEDKSWAIISPYRSEYAEEENRKRMAQLKSSVRKYGFIEFISRWVEYGESFDERSLLIPNISTNEAIKLGKEFQQSSIIVCDNSECVEICTTPFEGYKEGEIVRRYNISGNNILNIKDAEEIFAKRKGGPASRPVKGSKSFHLSEIYEVEQPRPSYFQTKENIIGKISNEALSPADYSPKRTGKAYKVFRVRNGKLYPPMVANIGGTDTPIGVWLDAEEGEFAGLSKTGRPQVKSTQSGTLSYRPGWHLADIPRAKQFDRTNKETGEKEFPKDFVWAEVEYAMDKDYQKDSDEQGFMRTKVDDKGNVITYRSDKYQHSLAGLPKLPKDGYYKYRTNPNPDTVPWVITGQMKVNRLLSDKEVNDVLKSKGEAPIHRQGGDKTLAELGLKENMKESVENNRYEFIISKRVLDIDGFMTDYTMYLDHKKNVYIFMFGDEDITEPDVEYADWVAETEKEAYEWFSTYEGFTDEDEDTDDDYNF